MEWLDDLIGQTVGLDTAPLIKNLISVPDINVLVLDEL
jgi:hypothetical protein